MVHSKNSFVSIKVSKETTVSTGIPHLGVSYKKLSNWTCGVGVAQKNPTPTPGAVKNPTPPKNLGESKFFILGKQQHFV